jgi:DNA-directed RNA polymerase subunit F
MNQLETIQHESSMVTAESQRAIQEVQAALVMAKRFPRDVSKCIDRITTACTRTRLADQAVYEYARGGTNISGPSIRLAEIIAQYWGNVQFGFDELCRGVGDDGVGYSEVRAYAWDIETNAKRSVQFRLRHWRDKKNGGGYKVTDERDIYEMVASQAQRRVRACIMAVIPGDVFDEAVAQCEVTLKADAKNDKEAVQKLIAAFDALKVTRKQIEQRIQRKIAAITPAQVVQLRKIYSSIKDGMSSTSDWFDVEPESPDLGDESHDNPDFDKAVDEAMKKKDASND